MKPMSRLHSFVMEQAESQPMDRAAQIYRDLALIVGTADEARALNQLADDIDAIVVLRRQIAANLAASRRPSA